MAIHLSADKLPKVVLRRAPKVASRLEIKSFILKSGAFRGNLTLHTGLANYCTAIKGDKIFHLFLDCDDSPKLRQIFDGIVLLRKEFPELASEKFFIINTSANRFSIVCFVRLTWKRYLDIMWRAVEIGIEHYGHAFYSTRKEYAVLRTGGKYGIVPRILYSLGDVTTCKPCMRDFTKEVRKWSNAKTIGSEGGA
jgi:hypothetical protein